jgi:hypothetical protein
MDPAKLINLVLEIRPSAGAGSSWPQRIHHSDASPKAFVLVEAVVERGGARLLGAYHEEVGHRRHGVGSPRIQYRNHAHWTRFEPAQRCQTRMLPVSAVARTLRVVRGEPRPPCGVAPRERLYAGDDAPKLY